MNSYSPMHFVTFTTLLAVACGVSLQVDPDSLSASQTIKQVQLTMQVSSNDSLAQLKGCGALQLLAMAHRTNEPGPYGGKRVSTALLLDGIGEAFAVGLLNSVAIDVAANRSHPSASSTLCYSGFGGLIVQNDYDKGLALINNAPHLWKAIVTYFEAFQGDQMINASFCMFAGLFGTPQPAEAAAAEVAAGAVDFIMGYLEDESLKDDPEMFQRVWCALSDPVHEQSGVFARAMANYGGHLQGIPVLVNSLQMAVESGSTFHEGNGYGLLYEAIHVIGGVMERDDENKSFAHAFVQAGLAPLMVPLMEREPDDNVLQDMSCEAMKYITDDTVAVQNQLAQEGAIEVMAKALKRFTHPQIHGYGGVTGTCSAALLNFAESSTEWQDKMLKLGVSDALDEEVLLNFPRDGADEFFPRAKDFPNSNIYRLKEVLEQRAT